MMQSEGDFKFLIQETTENLLDGTSIEIVNRPTKQMMMLALTNNVSEVVVRDLLKHLKLKNVNIKTLQSIVHPCTLQLLSKSQ